MKATKASVEATILTRSSSSRLSVVQKTHSPVSSKNLIASSSLCLICAGTIGVAAICVCGCRSDVPADSPWFLNMMIASTRGSFRIWM